MSTRREFLAAGAALLAAGCTETAPPLPAGAMLSTNHAFGHRLRDGGLARSSERRKARVVIVGSGIAGIAAAWRLRRGGFADFEILELEDRPGGNARWAENAFTRYPWGAHYIPLPTAESRSTRLLLAELEVLLGDPEAEVPRYEERALVQAPQERLFRDGTWSDGLAPLEGHGPKEQAEWQRFQARIREFQAMRGKDGRRAFAIPLEYASRDPALLALDRVTMQAWLRAEGFVSEPVHWVANYACRDDYGCDYRVASAWAGIHYFACRTGAARDAEHDAVLTWPEGNGFIVRQLIERYGLALTHGALVHRIEEGPRGVTVGVHLEREQRAIEIQAEHVVWAAPFGFAARALGGGELAAAMRTYDYAPWITANLTLSEPPYAHHGAPIAWDNVMYEGPSLGYVVATHQGLASYPGPTVLTWYLPLTRASPAEGRQRLLSVARERWVEAAFAEISRPHPEIRAITERADIFANGHAMVIPRPGVIWGEARRRIAAHRGRLHFAHADASGLSLFEEATDRGVAAAESVLAALGGKTESMRAHLEEPCRSSRLRCWA